MGTAFRTAAAVVAAATCFAAARAARADEPARVGYAVVVRVGVDAAEERSVVGALVEATSRGGRGAATPEASAALKLRADCATSPACVKKAARTLGVDAIALVTLAAAAGFVGVDVRLFDGTSGTELRRARAEYDRGVGDAAAQTACAQLVGELWPPAVTPATVPEPGEVARGIEPTGPAEPVMPPPSGRDRGEGGSRRWWLWGGVGVATVAASVALFLVVRDDGSSGPSLELPPPP